MKQSKSLFWSLVSTAFFSLIWAMSAMFINFENFSWTPEQIYLIVITTVAGSSAMSTLYIFLIKLPGFKQLHQKMINKKEAKNQAKIEMKKTKIIEKEKEKKEKKQFKKEFKEQKKLEKKQLKEISQEDEIEDNKE